MFQFRTWSAETKVFTEGGRQQNLDETDLMMPICHASDPRQENPHP